MVSTFQRLTARGNPESNNESNSQTRSLNSDGNNKTRLRNELTNLYGGNNGFLNRREINDFVEKLNSRGSNTLNIKKQAYKKAYTKYMNYMAGDFTQDIIRAIKAKMKSSPKCPSGVEAGGPSIRGVAGAVIGGVRTAVGVGRQNGRPSRRTAGQTPARYANGNRRGGVETRSR